MEHIVFLTGHLAREPLERVLAGIADAPFSWQVLDVGVQVAALMTPELVRRRVPGPLQASRVLLPGRCSGDVEALQSHFGVPVQRGPDELKDLPRFFDRAAHAAELPRGAPLLFAEIVDAPRLSVAAIVERAHAHRRDGADVIDLGALPGVAFGHLAEAVQALKAEGHRVSVDSLDPAELRRGAEAGADYLLSLTPDTLWLADEVAATPVLIPRTPQDTASLEASIAELRRRGRAFLADPILDPIPFGFAASIARYHALRARDPEVPLLMGIGNLTELVEADTSGMNALLLGVAAELGVAAVLTTQVSAHARRALAEADWARRIMGAAMRERSLPKGLGDALLTVHDKAPFPDGEDEIEALAAQVRDPNFRVQVAAAGLHVYNRDGLRRGRTPFELWPRLGLQDDASHAFYMGVELARAEIAWRLGKRYVQDRPLAWGCAEDEAAGTDDGTGRCGP